MQESDQILAIAQHVAFMLVGFLVEKGFLNLEDNIGFFEYRFFAINQNGAGCLVFIIGEKRAFAGALLHINGRAFIHHFLDGFRGGRDAVLARHDFLGHADGHS